MDDKWLLWEGGGGIGASAGQDWRDLPPSMLQLSVITVSNQRLFYRRFTHPAKLPRAARRPWWLACVSGGKPDNEHNSTTPPVAATSLYFDDPLSHLCHHAPCCLLQTDRAVQLLLETSADNPSYYCDSLKACLVTTITSSGPSQSTIKLVATNMIANGKLAGAHATAFCCSSLLAVQMIERLIYDISSV